MAVAAPYADTWNFDTAPWSLLNDAPAAIDNPSRTYRYNTKRINIATTYNSSVEVVFAYTAGGFRIDVAGVDLIDPSTGDVVKGDYHDGYSGGKQSNKEYSIRDVAPGNYILRYISYDQSTSSAGNISVRVVPGQGFYRLKNVATDKYLTAISGPQAYTSTTRGVYANGDANSAATVIRLYDKDSNGTLYMYNQGEGFGWVDASKTYGAGVGYLSVSPDKYVNWFSGTAAGQVAFAICLGNGTGEWADYLRKGIYKADTSDDTVIGGTDETADEAQWVIEEATSVTVAMHSDGAGKYYATFCAPFSYTVSDATAYTLEKSGNVLTPTEVPGAVPAGTPVLLEGTSSAATLTISGTGYAATPITADLTGTYLAKTINGGSDYVLGINGGVVGFYHWNSNNLGANRAYVAGGGSSVKGYVLNFDDDATAIEMVNGQSSMVNGQPIYNLAGQRISKMQKGINIVNGKKIMVK